MKLTTKQLTLCAVLTAMALALSYLENLFPLSLAIPRLGRLSVYGVSVGGAAAHNCGQIAAAVLTLGSTAPLAYLPVLLAASLLTGAVTGVAAVCLFRALDHTGVLRPR